MQPFNDLQQTSQLSPGMNYRIFAIKFSSLRDLCGGH